MSALNRQISKVFGTNVKPLTNFGYKAWTPFAPVPAFRAFYDTFIWPTYFTFVKAPHDRFMYATELKRLREYGLMYDDLMNDRLPVIELACELLPLDLKAGRFRRQTRASQLNLLKVHLPIELQNYDPFIPYLAPYVEEAKLILQEENELMAYHPWDRRFCSGDVSGFGESGQGEALMTTYQF